MIEHHSVNEQFAVFIALLMYMAYFMVQVNNQK